MTSVLAPHGDDQLSDHEDSGKSYAGTRSSPVALPSRLRQSLARRNGPLQLADARSPPSRRKRRATGGRH